MARLEACSARAERSRSRSAENENPGVVFCLAWNLLSENVIVSLPPSHKSHEPITPAKKHCAHQGRVVSRNDCSGTQMSADTSDLSRARGGVSRHTCIHTATRA